MEPDDQDNPRRRLTDRQRDLEAKEQIDAIIHVVCEYIGCDKRELFDGLHGLIRKNRRNRKIWDGMNVAITGVIATAVLTGIGWVILLAAKNFEGFN